MEDIQADGQTQGHKSHWELVVAVAIVLVAIAVIWGDKRPTQPAYMEAANAPAENPGLTGVSDEYRAGVEEARNAPPQK